jgi:hypothetical protein
MTTNQDGGFRQKLNKILSELVMDENSCPSVASDRIVSLVRELVASDGGSLESNIARTEILSRLEEGK